MANSNKSTSEQKDFVRPSNSLSTALIDSLLAMNPWWQGQSQREIPPLRRPIYYKIFTGLQQSRPQIQMLRGPRQVGKSTIQEQMIFDLLHLRNPISAKQIFYISLDKITVFPNIDPIITIVRWYEQNVVQDNFNDMQKKNKPIYIFLDEIQDVDNWSVQLKHIVDIRDCHIFATGSSALRIKLGQANLPGRASWHELSVLGLPEIAQMRGMGNLHPYTTGNNVEKWRDKEFWTGLGTLENNSLYLNDAYNFFSEFGGYPFCHAKNQTWDDAGEFLKRTVVGRTIEQDVVTNFQREGISIPSSSTLQHLFHVLCKYDGRDVHIATIQRELKEGFSDNLKHNQIRKYLDFFADSMLVRIIKPTEHRLKDTKERVKICLCDHALRRAIMGEYVSLVDSGAANDLVGSIVEGIIGAYLSLFSGVELNYLSGNESEDEVDFIVTIGDFRIPIEVKYQNNPTVSKGIKQYLERPQHNTKFGILLTKDQHWVKDNIIAIPVKNFLLLK